jgi:hypothetical protein
MEPLLDATSRHREGRQPWRPAGTAFELVTGVGRQPTVALYVVLEVAGIVAVDVLFFRQQFWERLLANIGMVLVFAAFYLRFLKHA